MKKLLLVGLIGAFTSMAIGQEGAITNEVFQEIRKSITDDADGRALINATTNNDIRKLALNRAVQGKVNHYFSHKVKTAGITDQKSTGRCWLFTGLNVLKPVLMEKLNVKSIELSQNYNFFFDQLEKSNLFLEAIIATRDKPADDRTVDWLFKNPIQDGGQWTTFADIVKKYGVVPKSVMPETFQSQNTRMMRRLMARKLREDGVGLRKMQEEGKDLSQIRIAKVEMLSDIYRILALCLGEPPVNFTWQYEDKEGELKQLSAMTPRQFYEDYVGINLDEYVMFMNDPSRPYFQLYEIEYDRSMIDGYNWKFVNLPNKQIKEYASASIIDNQAMYFSCDVGKQLNRTAGTLDIENYDYDDLMGVEFGMNKADRIITYSSASTHGMALIGVNMNEEGDIDKWLLENSWGAKAGNKGYLTMTDAWFDEYMFRIIINKKYVDAETLKILEQKPVLLPPWDPMFSPEE